MLCIFRKKLCNRNCGGRKSIRGSFRESLEKTRKSSIIMDSENACNCEGAEQLQMSEMVTMKALNSYVK